MIWIWKKHNKLFTLDMLLKLEIVGEIIDKEKLLNV